MSVHVSITLVAAASLLVGFVNSQQRLLRGFGGASGGFFLALNISCLLGTVAALALFGYHFYLSPWYWSAILFIVAGLLGGLMFAFIGPVIGQLPLTLLSFVGWPAMAFWMWSILSGMAR